MKIQHKTASAIFVFGITFVMLTTVVYTLAGRGHEIEMARETSSQYMNQAIEHIEAHIGEQINMARTLANSWVLKEELTKSNEALAKLKDNERAELIKSLNERWMAARDVNAPFVRQYMTSTAARVLNGHAETFPDTVGEIFVTGIYGHVVGTTNKLTTIAHAHKYWWIESFNNANGKVFIDDRGFDESVGGYVLGIVVPVYNGKGIAGILKVNVNIVEHLMHLVFLHKEANPGQMSIARSLGKIVYEEGKEPLSTSVDKQIVEQFSKDRKGHITLKTRQENVLYTYAVLPLTNGSKDIGFGGKKESIDHRGGNTGEGWYVVIARSYDDILAGMSNTNRLIIAYGALVSIVMGFLALRLGISISRPIKVLSDAVKEIGQGRLNTKIAINTNDETGELADAFNAMTANLSKVTASRDELNKEVADRTNVERELRRSEEKYRLLVDNTDTGFVVVDDKGMVVEANDPYVRLAGARRVEEIIGRSVNQWTAPEAHEQNAKAIELCAQQGFVKDLEMIYLGMDGVRRNILLNATLQNTSDGKRLTALCKDITERRLAERRIEKSLREKEVLLMEIHHRVKNNMAVISSLLELQSSYVDDEKYRIMFNETQSRIKSMALLHEKLYQSADFSRIDVRDYIESLTAIAVQTNKTDKQAVEQSTNVQVPNLDIDLLIPLGLIINELVTNSYKHAFNGQRGCTVEVSLTREDEDIVLVVADNGTGIPMQVDIETSRTLGLKIVRILANQIQAKLQIARGGGTKITLKMNLPVAETTGYPQKGKELTTPWRDQGECAGALKSKENDD